MEQTFTFEQDWDNEGTIRYRNSKTLKHYRQLKDDCSKLDMQQFDCFFAFSDEQFKQGLANIRPLKEGDKLVSIGGGGYATADGAKRLREYYRSVDERIKNECDPQEVYCYEFNNYESCYAYDGDMNAFALVIGYFGAEAARKVQRFCAFYGTEELIEKYS